MIGCNKLKEVFIMKTKDLPNVASALIEKMKSDGYSSSRIEDTTWILEHFFNYCVKHDIIQVTVPIAVEFVQESFGFDFYNTTSRFQTVLRRPLLSGMCRLPVGQRLPSSAASSRAGSRERAPPPSVWGIP